MDTDLMSKSRISVIFSLTMLWFTIVSSGDIICNEDDECRSNATLTTCVDNEVCNIICNGTTSCDGSTFTCPSTAECNIHCQTSPNVCSQSTILARQSTKLNLICDGQTACYMSTIQCPLNGDCNIQPGKGDNAMTRISVNASASTGNLNIESLVKDTTRSVTGWHSLSSSSVYCPMSGNCYFNLYGQRSLYLANIYATDSDGVVNITVSGKEAAKKMNLYCPDAYQGTPNCIIRVIQDVDTDYGMLYDLTIHANRSFEQVSIESVGLLDPRRSFMDPTLSSAIQPPEIHCQSDAQMCGMTYVNGEYQCTEASVCNIANPNLVVTGSDFTNLCQTAASCQYYTIQCDEGRPCHIPCIGNAACLKTTIRCPTNDVCNVTATGFDVLSNAQIYCPETDFATEPQCIINVAANHGAYGGSLATMDIYAKGGLTNDVSITCDYASSIDGCYDSGKDENPNVHCTDDYSANCTIELVNGFSGWECIETDSICYNYAPKCTFIGGQPCSVSGDPHTRTWNGALHAFQGQPRNGKNQFYYIYPCAHSSVNHLPFTVLGKHYQWGSKSVSGLDYITMQLYDDNGDIYYLWLSSSIHSYLNATAAVNTLYDDNTAATLVTYDTATPIGNRFNITITSSSNPARIDVALTIDGKCDVNLYMISQGNHVNGRDRMHYLHIDPPECYRCFICGLCGDFERVSTDSEWEQMETCDGGFVSYRAGWSATITEAYDINGWTWEQSYVEATCANRTALPTDPIVYGVSAGDNFTYVPKCDPSIESQVISECAAAKTAQSACCDLIGNGYCDQLQTNCESDACAGSVASGTNVTVISRHVQSVFTDPVNFTCNLPNVEALYNESNLQVTLNASGTAVVPNCFGVDGGNWTLVRHAYNEWHPATDNVNGTDEYGTYDNHPQSMSSWS
eukprot:311920_1